MVRNSTFPGNSHTYEDINQELQEEYRGNRQRSSQNDLSADTSDHASVNIDNLNSQPNYRTDLAFFQQFNNSGAELIWPTTSAESYSDYVNWTNSQLTAGTTSWHQQFMPGTILSPSSPPFYLTQLPPGSGAHSPPLLSSSMQQQPVLRSNDSDTVGGTAQSTLRGYSAAELDQEYESQSNNEADTNNGRRLGTTRPGRIPRTRERGSNQPFRSCWRCKRYRKPCDENAVCNSCVMTSGFRVWPSSLGCRRGSLEDCVSLILPEINPQSLDLMNTQYHKPFNWRSIGRESEYELGARLNDREEDLYDKTIHLIRLTKVHGPGIVELLQAAARFQQSQAKENPALQTAFSSLSIVMDIYHSLISTNESEPYDQSESLVEKFVSARRAMIRYTDRFLLSCLTGRVRSWPTTFLAANIGVVAFVFLADAILAIPEPIRIQIWKDLRQIILDLRNKLYSIARDLLLALSKGVEMLNMSCWNYVQTATKGIKEETYDMQPNNHGFQLMDHDKDLFDLMCELAKWRTEFESELRDDTWMSIDPFELDLPIIKSLSRLFSMVE